MKGTTSQAGDAGVGIRKPRAWPACEERARKGPGLFKFAQTAGQDAPAACGGDLPPPSGASCTEWLKGGRRTGSKQMACAFCRSKPMAPGHPFCGRKCASQAAAAGWIGGTPPPAAVLPVVARPIPQPPTAGVAAPGYCAWCHARPVSHGHPFCGRHCAGTAKAAKWSPPIAPAAHASPIAAPAPIAYSKGAATAAPQPTAAAVCSQPSQATVLPAPPHAISTYSVRFPFNPEGWGMTVNPDLSIGTVTPGGIEDQAGVL